MKIKNCEKVLMATVTALDIMLVDTCGGVK